MAAAATPLRCMTRVHKQDPYTPFTRLVSDKLLQRVEGPLMQTPFLAGHPFRCLVSYAVEVFQGNEGAVVPDGFIDNTFRDAVQVIQREAVLPFGHLLECPAGRTGAFTLEASAFLKVTVFVPRELVAGIELPGRGNGEVGYTQINAENPVSPAVSGRLADGEVQEELSGVFPVVEGRGAPLVVRIIEVPFLEIPDEVFKLTPTIHCSDSAVTIMDTDSPTVVDNGPVCFWAGFGGPTVVGELNDTSFYLVSSPVPGLHNQVGREVGKVPHVIVGFVVQGGFAVVFTAILVPSGLNNEGHSPAELPECLQKEGFLFLRDIQLDTYRFC